MIRCQEEIVAMVNKKIEDAMVHLVTAQKFMNILDEEHYDQAQTVMDESLLEFLSVECINDAASCDEAEEECCKCEESIEKDFAISQLKTNVCVLNKIVEMLTKSEDK